MPGVRQEVKPAGGDPAGFFHSLLPEELIGASYLHPPSVSREPGQTWIA
jgi:hypothetical protein